MLGAILERLTDEAWAEEIVATIAAPELAGRIKRTAAADGVGVGALVASKVRHLLDHGSEEIWLDLVGAMNGSCRPGLAALERLLARAFPAPRHVRP